MRAYVLAFAGVLSSVAYAQRGVGDWSTTGFDAQRSHWVRSDAKINSAALKKGGFALDWKASTTTKSSLSAPLLIDFYIGYRGFRSLGFVGSTNSVTAFDTDLGRTEWTKSLPASGCAGAPILLSRPVNAAYPPLMSQFRGGRSTPAKSAVGEPGEGAVTVKPALARLTTAPPASPKPTLQPKPINLDNNPFAPRVQYVYALTQDGNLHLIYVSNGEEPNDPIRLLPAGGKASGLIVVDNVAYVSTSDTCGGVQDGIHAVDLPSKKMSSWKSASKNVGAPAFGPDGTLYVAAGKELVALTARTLEAKGTYSLPSGEFAGPVTIFEVGGKNVLSAPTRDGKLMAIDASAMQPLGEPTSVAVSGAVASWQDTDGTRWLLVPGAKGLTAYKAALNSGALALTQAWTSSAISDPGTPIVVSDAVFVVSRGKQAVLRALDARSGTEVWNSGSAIAGVVRTGSLSAGGSRVYLSTEDGVQYAFSFPIEH